MKKHLKPLIILTVTLSIFTFFILYLKPNNKNINVTVSDLKHIEYDKTNKYDKTNEFDDSSTINLEKNINTKRLDNNTMSESSLFFKKSFENGEDIESIANMFISGKILELNLSEEAIQDICNKTLPFVKSTTVSLLFNNNCKPNNSSASISLINSYLLDNNSIDQKEIIKKLDLYKNNGLLVSDKEYYFNGYSEKTNLYEKAVGFGLIEVMDYLEKNGMHSQNKNLIDIQLNGMPSLNTIKYLMNKGYKISEISKENFLNNENYKKNYSDIYQLISES